VVIAVALAVIGMWPLLNGKPIRGWALLVSGIFLLSALLRPSVLSRLNRLWTKFGLLLSKITNPLILGLMFFFVFAPVGLILRLLRKDLLRLKRDSQAPSYWLRRQPPGPAPDTMGNQF
jgi:hypothetical protein